MKLIGKDKADSRSDLKIPGARRADLFSRMALKASIGASKDFEFPTGDPDTGIIVTTQFGPHATTFKFLDGMLEHSDTKVSPTLFSHSVHNAATSYIATVLDLRGPTLTFTCFKEPLFQAFALADIWIKLKRVSRVLLCYVEEKSIPFDTFHKHSSMPSYSKKGIKEGAVAFLLTEGEGFVIPDGP
ncbi:hypothetical protein MTBBW1_80153 [Desulfamplus magnetovallimortis]|uniref:Beta-ketoacyl synthase-like N-terminal domain-containing protein n=1 Tax=Desulfamplus magnetovallimortis TaxID=1246637 RepID=L0R4H0_9BACT|nr:beta-ketoacyl synthase chain length factor [Desulfamplus magnetovallimortis]CCO06759.1 hypothetical protein DEMABW1_80153 [Desulfamplus magnetovallimortis BW-1]SLM32810.1 hypothetical protein MTBBW1_80153 [Desulfamplus magnetovallimortis]